LDVLQSQGGVFVYDLLSGQPSSEVIEDYRDKNTCALNAGLTMTNLKVNGDTIMPIYFCAILHSASILPCISRPVKPGRERVG
jgi:hypothetical protein